MPREISDEEYNFLQSRRVTADFVESIYNNPKLNGKAKALIKEAYPQLEIPPDSQDVRREIDARFAAEAHARQQAETQAREKAEDEAWKTARAKAQKDSGLTDEGMNDIDKWMLENRVGNYEVALRERAHRMPRPVEAYQDQYWRHEQTPGWNEIAKDPEKWANKEILEAIYRGQDQLRRG